jgi:hypothetical protein
MAVAGEPSPAGGLQVPFRPLVVGVFDEDVLWQGSPIDVVKMDNGTMTAFDNTRVLAASRAGIDVRAIIHTSDEAFPAGR